jgi:hypothetical protein
MRKFVAEPFRSLRFTQVGGEENRMKLPFVISSVLILSLSAAQAVEQNASLGAGKPAGLRQAQLEDGYGMFVVAGAALIGITIALATASNNSAQPAGSTGGSSTTSSTTTTTP